MRRFIQGLFILMIGGVGLSCASISVRVQEATAKGDEAYLLEQLTESKEEWIVEDAALGLGHLKSRKAVPHLIRLLEDPKAGPYRRAAAATALGEIGDPSALAPLIASMDRAQEPNERYAITQAVGRFVLRDERAVAFLESLKDDPDLLVARCARKALYEREKALKENPPSPDSGGTPDR